MGCSPCFEPYESNIYRYSAYSKEITVINEYLVKDLNKLGIDKPNFKKMFIKHSGRLGSIKLENYCEKYNNMNLQEKIFFSKECQRLKKIYRVAAFEISPNKILKMAEAAQPYIDQSQSMNLWVNEININVWNYYNKARKMGLKTLCYYIKTDSANKEESCPGGTCTI
jgi:ribonucleotide reductase alpha subunit